MSKSQITINTIAGSSERAEELAREEVLRLIDQGYDLGLWHTVPRAEGGFMSAAHLERVSE